LEKFSLTHWVVQMAMVKAYRLNLALKFTGVAVAGELSTATLVNTANAVWGHLPNPRTPHSLPSATHHFHPKNERPGFSWRKFNIENQAVETIRPNEIHRLGL
jgi:hypothetical protein